MASTTMSNRERILAILEKRSPDRIPWIPRLEIWYQAQKARGTLPEAYQGLSLREIEYSLNTGTPGRQGSVYRNLFRHSGKRSCQYRGVNETCTSLFRSA